MRRVTAAGVLCLLLCLATSVSAGAEKGVVTASALILRQGPSLSFPLICEIPYDAELTLFSYEEGWYLTCYNGQYGYVSARYVRVALPEGAQTQPDITPEPLPAGTPPPGFSLPVLTFTGENNPGYPFVMKPGDMGNSVFDLQRTLRSLGYDVSFDGQYGYDTQAAVMKLQNALGLDADGVVGGQTRAAVGKQNDGVELLDWWLGGNLAFARLTEATVVDVRTGVRFRISRYGGDNHCDAEPLTAQDAQTIRSIAGEAWSWERRPIWLEVSDRVIAASMHCMPHDGQHVTDNDFDGHFCIHFYNSRTHETDRIDEAHAACVQEAWERRFDYSP